MAVSSASETHPGASVSVALLQLRSRGPDVEYSLAEGERACREAAARGADIALFPEMWSIGYQSCPLDEAGRERWMEMAVTAEGSYVGHFRALAKELGIAICITYLEKWDGLPRNSATVIDRDGEIVFTYAKVHTCDFDNEANVTPGDAFPTGEVQLAVGSVRVGVMICYDREFPESARCLMIDGAELILTPNASSLPTGRIEQFRTRAMENMLGVAMANYAAPIEGDEEAEWDGRSIAVAGPMVTAEEEWVDPTLVLADEREGIHIATFDLDELREYRTREGWGDAYRKPRRYGALVSDAPPVPAFQRPDARRGA
jgi:N-carbamoylputrescine amidase